MQERVSFEKETKFEDLFNRKKSNIVKRVGGFSDGMNFATLYARVLVHSFEKFRLLMFNVIHKELLNVVFLRCFEDYLFVRNRYIFCLKAIKDYLFLRLFYAKFFEFILFKFRSLKALHFKDRSKLFYFLNVFFSKINVYFSVISKILTGFFFKQFKQRLFYFIKNKFFLKHNSSYFFKKSLGGILKRKFCKFGFFSLNFFLFKKFMKVRNISAYLNYIKYFKHRVKTAFHLSFLLVNRSFSSFVIYLKRLLDCYNYRVSLLSSLFKHNYS